MGVLFCSQDLEFRDEKKEGFSISLVVSTYIMLLLLQGFGLLPVVIVKLLTFLFFVWVDGYFNCMPRI